MVRYQGAAVRLARRGGGLAAAASVGGAGSVSSTGASSSNGYWLPHFGQKRVPSCCGSPQNGQYLIAGLVLPSRSSSRRPRASPVGHDRSPQCTENGLLVPRLHAPGTLGREL